MGFDILSNVASDIIIEETASDTCVNEVLLSTLTASISSDDRFQVHICSLKFIYSEKAAKMWWILQILFEITALKKRGWFRKICVALSQILNFIRFCYKYIF